mgnify:CR=1 FL=1
MGQIRVVLIFNEDNDRQKEVGEYLKSQKRCKTALITELVYAWLHKDNKAVFSYNNVNVDIEELKQQLLQDQEFMQQIKGCIDVGNKVENTREEKNSELDMDEDLLLAGLSMFENQI